MKTPLSLCWLFAFFAAASIVSAAPAPDEERESAAPFQAMRTRYAAQPGFTGMWTLDDERQALLKTFREDQPQPFIDGSAKWLRKCPVDAKVHLMRASLLLKAGDLRGHFYHRMVFYGLMTSIVTSGDGQGPKTAYKVISVDEEYTLLNYLGAKVKTQSLVEGPCDAMAVELNGKDTTIYFDVSIPMRATQKELDAGKNAGKK